MALTSVLSALGRGAFRRFSTAAVGWEHCRSVPELIHAVQRHGALDKPAVDSLECKARQLLSGNLRDAAMLALMLHNLGGDAQQLLAEVPAAQDVADFDLFFRASAECGASTPPSNAADVLSAPGALEKPRQVYNYLCGACLFNSRGAALDLNQLLQRLSDMGCCHFSTLQLLQMAAALAALAAVEHGSSLDALCKEIYTRGLQDVHMADVIESMAQLSKHHQDPAMLAAFEKALLQHCTERELPPAELCSALYTISRYRRYDPLLMDRLAVNLRRDAGSYDLAQLARAVLALSQIGYHNRSLVVLMGRMVLTLIDGDSTVDAQLLTNLYTGFSRFLHHGRLFTTFSEILRKEEVLADLQPSDAVAVVQSYARVHVVDERLFSLFDAKLFSQPLNTTLSFKLLVAHGKLRYRNPRLQNALINNINLQELDSSIQREKLKLASERLGLFFPELTDTAQEDELPRITWRRLDPVRRRVPHVRRRKWTW
ncbi:hypothetical protein, conserved [Babesia bigemina]|uniref:RAP domain-containing protein n=1 Tax=Babesia bigemina TaxID=5866 RepID=A0A061D6V9_BABBI|nr:hypothetical protein, conserved [Babesia bigemina]CDR96436.1 hypothetical protein, conserved [Babesia bigemina]|eukprot:XP_012768622.1 hypothetical protein, conserved [Babesia bigemina]